MRDLCCVSSERLKASRRWRRRQQQPLFAPPPRNRRRNSGNRERERSHCDSRHLQPPSKPRRDARGKRPRALYAAPNYHSRRDQREQIAAGERRSGCGHERRASRYITETSVSLSLSLIGSSALRLFGSLAPLARRHFSAASRARLRSLSLAAAPFALRALSPVHSSVFSCLIKQCFSRTQSSICVCSQQIERRRDDNNNNDRLFIDDDFCRAHRVARSPAAWLIFRFRPASFAPRRERGQTTIAALGKLLCLRATRYLLRKRLACSCNRIARLLYRLYALPCSIIASPD